MKLNVKFSPMTLAEAELLRPVVVAKIGGERAFRRRLLELGLVPGTVVTVEKVAPLGDPLELSARGCTLSIRRSEAGAVTVEPQRSAS
jgi:ferrous iron transport protein A